MAPTPHAGPDPDDDDGPGIVTDDPPVDIDQDHPEPVTAARTHTARRTPLQAALAAAGRTVRCRYCHAPPRWPCVDHRAPGHPPTAVPHACRIADARKLRTAGATPIPARTVAS